MLEWVHRPFGLDTVSGQTVRSRRTVLMVVHSPVPMPCGPGGCRELRRLRGRALRYPGPARPVVDAIQAGVGE